MSRLVAKAVVVTEYGLLMSSGGFLTFNTSPEVEKIYPTDQKIANEIRTGGHVYRRRIAVVEDWEEVDA